MVNLEESKNNDGKDAKMRNPMSAEKMFGIVLTPEFRAAKDKFVEILANRKQDKFLDDVKEYFDK